jgi:hypothetical protein
MDYVKSKSHESINCLIFTHTVNSIKETNFMDTLLFYNLTKFPKILIIYTGGHYYALCKVDDKWYKFNDSTVSLVRNIEIPSGTIPKIIVYEKA